MNPMQLPKLKKLWDEFASRHPKFPLFLKETIRAGIQEGTILEMKVISPDGKTSVANLKVKKEDLELIRSLQKMQ